MLTRIFGAPALLVAAGEGTEPLRNNLAHHVGDDIQAVLARREAYESQLGRRIVWMNQTHSATVAVLSYEGERAVVRIGDEERPFDTEDPHSYVDADGLIVDGRGWGAAPAVGVLTADCLPVLFVAECASLVAAVHAGRRGVQTGILPAAVAKLHTLTSGPINAFIGPAICGSCYEVPQALQAECEGVTPGISSQTSWGTAGLDITAAARKQLIDAGCVRVEVDGRCTFEDKFLHSYRRDSACGRNAAIICPR